MITERRGLFTVGLTMAVFVVLRFAGTDLFDNNWSFQHWQHLSNIYIGTWFVVGLVFTALLVVFRNWISPIATTRTGAIIAGAMIMILLVVLRADSFVFGGGNLKVAQLSQTPVVIYPWYEWGTIALVHGIYTIIAGFYKYNNLAAFHSWQIVSIAFSLVTLIASMKTVRLLASGATNRLLLFFPIFFGPHTFLLFGSTGTEMALVATSAWFAYALTAYVKSGRLAHLYHLWIVLVVGVIFQASALLLLPVAIFITVQGLIGRKDKVSVAASIAGLTAWAIGITALYIFLENNFGFSKYFLYLSGKAPFGDYSIFSMRHLGDVVQVIFLAFPLMVLTKLLFLSAKRRSVLAVGATLMAIAGNSLMFILDPVDSILLDFPRLTAMLFANGFLLAVLLVDRFKESESAQSLLAVVAVVTIMIPASVFPAYNQIQTTAPHAKAYYDTNELYYMQGCYSFRDAYFALGDLDRANEWEWKLPIVSTDHLDLMGTNTLILNGEDSEAIRQLYRMKARNPYWLEARILFAALQIKAGRLQLAQPEVDTCLMLAPYQRDVVMNHYILLRDLQRNTEAKIAVDKAAKLFPDDQDIALDRMIISLNANDLNTAEALADSLLSADINLPQPYYIKARLAEQKRNYRMALTLYRKFIGRAASSPEAAYVKKRIENLTEIINQQSSN